MEEANRTMYGFSEKLWQILGPDFKQSTVPTMLGSRIRLILPFVVYFIGDQALVATQNIDQIKASSGVRCSCSIASWLVVLGRAFSFPSCILTMDGTDGHVENDI
jgi:hypothetical protein